MPYSDDGNHRQDRSVTASIEDAITAELRNEQGENNTKGRNDGNTLRKDIPKIYSENGILLVVLNWGNCV